MAHPTSCYVKKLKDGTVNQVVNDLIMAKDSEGRVSHKQYNEAVDALCKCGINITIDELYKRVEQEYKRKMMPNEIDITDNFTLGSTLTGDSVNNVSTGSNDSTNVTKSCSGHPKGTTDEKKRHDKKKNKDCVNSICEAYAEELTKREKHLPSHILDQLIKEEQFEFDTSQK